METVTISPMSNFPDPHLGASAPVPHAQFVESGETADVSEALDKLITSIIIPQLGPHLREARNDARRASCYTERAALAMQPQMISLRTVFAFYSTLCLASNGGSARKEALMLSPKELVAMCEDLLPGPKDANSPACFEYLSERDLQRVFLTSRMRVIDPINVSPCRLLHVLHPFVEDLVLTDIHSHLALIYAVLGWQGKRRLRFRNLQFEDFLEAFVRIALLTPVPSGDDLQELGVASAVEWYEQMEQPENSELWDAFVSAHVWPEGMTGADAPGSTKLITELVQHDPEATALGTRLRHLTEYIAHKVVGPGGDSVVGSTEMERFARRVGRESGTL